MSLVVSYQDSAGVPLTPEERAEVTKWLCSTGGTTVATMAADGLCVAYVSRQILRQVRTGKALMGTACGRKDNQFSSRICGRLLKSKCVVGLFWKDTVAKPNERAVVVSLAVKDFSEKESAGMERVANEDGCSLRPERVEIEGESWTIFESE